MMYFQIQIETQLNFRLTKEKKQKTQNVDTGSHN